MSGLRLSASIFICHLFLVLPSGPLTGQTSAQYEPEVAGDVAFPLTIESIMRGPEHVGSPPSAIRWTDDSRWVYFRWRPGGGAWDDDSRWYRVAGSGGQAEAVPEEKMDSLSLLFSGGDISPDRRTRVTSSDGDLYLVDRDRLTVTRLTDTRDGEGSPRFSADGSSIFFTLDNNVFEMALDGPRVRQITDVRSGPAPGEEAESQGQEAFLEEQQEELFDYIRRLKEDRAERDSAQAAAAEEGPQPTYLGPGERAGAPSINATGTYAMLQARRSGQEAERTMVPRWITESGYTEEMNVRTKVGDAQGSSRVGLLDVAYGELTWFDLYPGDDEVKEEDEERREALGQGYAYFAGWNDAGTHALVVSTSADRQWRWIYAVEAGTGELTLLDALHDEAWVGGPCSRCMGWLPGTDRAYFSSEATGYAHLYAVNANGSDKVQLTRGEWEVLDVEIPEGEDWFLLHTNEGSPFNQHVYTMAFDGSNKRAITTGAGLFEAALSPQRDRMAVIHSVANRPPELYLADFEPGSRMERITHSPTEEWVSFPWIKPEIIHFTARDGAEVPARIYRPSDLGAEANGAAVIFVHGAGYLHNVHHYWSTYYREYQFNHFLAANGYTVLDIDYRGSAGYGRDWRVGIYRWMGGKDLSDQTDGAAWLVEEEGIDPDRVGLYGGSYGGFITLMALFTEPDVFTSGAALRSVTDWAHYNHGYTSNILNLPQDDPEAYEKSSPIYFAENFRGHLVMLHGMVDTNVHFSDVVRLSQRLIELGKDNWELAVYPVEGHGFQVPSSWTDEYRRIFELFERTIRRPGCTEEGNLCPVRGMGG